MNSIIVKNISKQYHLGKIGTGTLSHDLNRWWSRIRGKEDPYLLVTEVNQRDEKGSNQHVWALQDISFEVKKGEVIGIIGKNGAGKSTLLKILSRTTMPTTGYIKAEGRIASLLEVGTGFHPEMTGRENIFLNGAILGMRRYEIKQKLDSIIDFAGIKRYIDIPVKRYSSGMYVRLAFSVAAHLDNEILIIDEALAVGDDEFQKKGLELIQRLNREEGRTVLFVSHNMYAINKICQKTILLENGLLKAKGNTQDIISNYLTNSRKITFTQESSISLPQKNVRITNCSFWQLGRATTTLLQGMPFEFFFVVKNCCTTPQQLYFNIELKSTLEDPITFFGNEFQLQDITLQANEKKQIRLYLADLCLRKGDYFVNLYFNNSLQWQEGIIEQNALCLHIESPQKEYFDKPDRQWRNFSSNKLHGHLPLKIEQLQQEVIS